MSIKLGLAAKELGVTPSVLHNVLLKRSVDLGVKIMSPNSIIENVEISDKAYSLIIYEINLIQSQINDLEYLRELRVTEVPDISKPVVYFLFQDDYILYIGMTNDLKRRISTHKKDKEFNYISIQVCNKYDVMLLEALYINKYCTGLNKNVYPMSVIVKMIIERIDIFDLV